LPPLASAARCGPHPLATPLATSPTKIHFLTDPPVPVEQTLNEQYAYETRRQTTIGLLPASAIYSITIVTISSSSSGSRAQRGVTASHTCIGSCSRPAGMYLPAAINASSASDRLIALRFRFYVPLDYRHVRFMQICDYRIFRIFQQSAHIAYFFPHKLAFSTAVLILFLFLLPISIRFRYLDHLVANRMALSMCPDPCGMRWGSWYQAILHHITAYLCRIFGVYAVNIYF